METNETNINNSQNRNTLDEQAKKLRRQKKRQMLASMLGIAILVVGIVQTTMIFIDYKRTETSNDAQIEQYISPVNLRASGYISKVCFTEHQSVRKGDTLLILDDREYRIRVMEAEAALKDALAGNAVINSTLKIATEYDATKKKLEALKRQQKAALSGVQEVSGRRENTEAAVQRAKAALEMAKLNLSYTVVVAPCDGKLGRRAIEEGQYIPAGQTITYIMPDSKKWIIANYKETQVENLHVGQDVAVTVDAISDREFKGKITAISGATGAKYSLVPTDNSAGNFVKIRQRIPVRIDFTDLSEEDNERLAAGMMAVVKAKL